MGSTEAKLQAMIDNGDKEIFINLINLPRRIHTNPPAFQRFMRIFFDNGFTTTDVGPQRTYRRP